MGNFMNKFFLALLIGCSSLFAGGKSSKPALSNDVVYESEEKGPLYESRVLLSLHSGPFFRNMSFEDSYEQLNQEAKKFVDAYQKQTAHEQKSIKVQCDTGRFGCTIFKEEVFKDLINLKVHEGNGTHLLNCIDKIQQGKVQKKNDL